MKKLLFKKATPVLMAALVLFSCKKENSVITAPVKVVDPPKPAAIVPTGPTYSQIPSDADASAIFLYNTTNAKYLPGNRGWQGCPVIGFEHGNLFAAWFAGETGEQPGNYIAVSVSTDNGVTWKQDALILAPDVATNRECDPTLWNDKYGNLHLSFTKTVGMWDGGSGGVWDINIKYENSAVQITKPVKLFPGIMNVKPTPIQGGSTMLFPVSGPGISGQWNSYPITTTPADLNGPFVYTATYDDSKLVFNTPVKLAKIPAVPTARSYDEHMVVDLDGTNYISMMREYDGLYTSKSANAGATWTVPAKFTDVGANVASRAFMGKLKSGNLLLVLNNSSNTYRDNLTAYLSADNGKTWPYKLKIDARVTVSYPDVTQDANGDIYLIYDWQRAPNGNVDLVHITEKNIMDGTITPAITIIQKLK